MATIKGVIKDYQLIPHVSGVIGGQVSGTVSSSYIASFQLNGQIVQVRGIGQLGWLTEMKCA